MKSIHYNLANHLLPNTITQSASNDLEYQLYSAIAYHDISRTATFKSDKNIFKTNKFYIAFYAAIYFNNIEEHELAIKCARRAIKLSPREYSVGIEYSFALFKLGKKRLSEYALRKSTSANKNEIPKTIKNNYKLFLKPDPDYVAFPDMFDMSILEANELKHHGWVYTFGLRRSFFLKPIPGKVLLSIVRSSMALGKYSDAKRYAQELSRINEFKNESEWLQVDILFQTKKYRETIQKCQDICFRRENYSRQEALKGSTWEEFVRKFPKCIDAESKIAKCWFELKEWSKAERSLNFVLAESANDIDMLTLRAKVYFETGRWLNIIQDATRVLNETPNNGDVLILRAKAHWMLDEEKEALKYIKRAWLTGKKETLEAIEDELRIFKDTIDKVDDDIVERKPQYRGTLTMLAQDTTEKYMADGGLGKIAHYCHTEWNAYDWSKSKLKYDSYVSITRDFVAEKRRAKYAFENAAKVQKSAKSAKLKS